MEMRIGHTVSINDLDKWIHDVLAGHINTEDDDDDYIDDDNAQVLIKIRSLILTKFFFKNLL